MGKEQFTEKEGMAEAERRIEEARRKGASELELSRLGLQRLPDSLCQLRHLQKLVVEDNDLTTLPVSLGELEQLQELDVHHNQLTALPEWLGKLNHLQRLNVEHNQLTALPEWLDKLNHLQRLNVSSNLLKALPESLGELKQLRRLYVHQNQLTLLPESIGVLCELESLSVSSNPLTKLPDSIGNLVSLESLSLGQTELASLPEPLSKLCSLKYLILGGSAITRLPEWIGSFRELEGLDLTNGGIVVFYWESSAKSWATGPFYAKKKRPGLLEPLPEPLRNLIFLRYLFLHGNDALGISNEILGATFDEVFRRPERPPAKPGKILEYYFRLRAGRRPLNEAKLILVGRGAAGKTSTVNRLVRDHFEKDEKKTEGIKITQWPVTLNQKENVRLNIWDFGGQEILHATHQFFLTQRSLYLVVLSGREGSQDADAEYWLRLIESFGGDSPVIVVLNKIKEHPFDVNRRALQQKFPSIHDFIKTDCEDGTGIEALRKAIERETDRLEHLRDPFPSSWFGIKDRLAGMKKKYMRFEEYREICARLDEKDKAAQEALAGNLHHLGVVLNFKDDPRLQDTHVLSPHWATQGIYTILNSKKAGATKGEIGLGDLSGILKANEYPRDMHRFLLDLMKKFQLCFSFPDDDTRYLIPELLGEQQPEEAAEFKPEKCLNFQYHYPVLPEGLLPRFIVRSHVLSEGQPRWRTGVILKLEGCRALVKADLQDKKVFVSVSGGQGHSRRRLLAIVRIYFEEIHGNIPRLQQVEMVPLPRYPSQAVPYQELLVLEKNRIPKLTRVVGEDVIELDVQELLNGVDLEGTRGKDRRTEVGGEAVRLFCSYSHTDESLRNELETHLKLLEHQGFIQSWYDTKIEAGEKFEDKIDENLLAADIILLLVSAAFFASDYCYKKEMPCALERHEKKEAQIIPIIVRDYNWQNAPFGYLNALPKNGTAVTLWPDRDTAWRNVSEGIERVVEGIRKKRSGGLT